MWHHRGRRQRMPAYLKLGVRTFSAEPAAIMPLKRLLMEQEV